MLGTAEILHSIITYQMCGIEWRKSKIVLTRAKLFSVSRHHPTPLEIEITANLKPQNYGVQRGACRRILSRSMFFFYNTSSRLTHFFLLLTASH